MKTIALLGGSFRLIHPAHFEMASYVHQVLGVDEVWFAFSLNPQKDAASYAPLHHLMEMGHILAKHYPDKPFVMSDIEYQLGTHKTCEVLSGIKARYPNHKFIWTMGADNLETFHTWENYEQIIENVPLAILDRPGYTDKARNSVTAQAYQHLNITDAKDLVTAEKGWCFLNNPPMDMASSNFLTRLQAGERQFGGTIQDVVDYIVMHGLYGTGQPQPVQTPGPQVPQP
jgi:nicotinate-nucleotide adenylyltransferase